MPPAERSIADVFQDIVRNVQDIIRAEVRLAKTEVRTEIAQTKSAAMAFAVGGIGAVFALFFALLAAVYGLSEFIPDWLAAMIVAVLLLLSASVALSTALKRLKRVDIIPKTIETLKENTQWPKPPTK